MMREISRVHARRIAVRAQWLTAHRPDSLADTAAKLSAVQVDATAYVAANADLVFWSRLGDQTSRADLAEALDEGELVEVLGFLRPADDVALFTAEMPPGPAPIPRTGGSPQLAGSTRTVTPIAGRWRCCVPRGRWRPARSRSTSR